MIYTVTFNPSLDYVVSVDDFTCGVINRTKEELLLPGGKGINVSMVLSNLGYENIALGFIAGFTGDKLEEILCEKGIHTDFIRVKNGMSRINVKLRSNEETEINGMGPKFSMVYVEELLSKLQKLQAGDILVLAGSVPASMPSTIYMDIMHLLQNEDIKVVVDARKELLLNVLEYKPFLIKPNTDELSELFGRNLKTKEEIIAGAKVLQEKGARNVLVSMAGDGAILVAEDGNVYMSKAPIGDVKNSVGAGDSMVAGFIAGYLNGENYQEALVQGVCAGSASAFSDFLATKDAVDELLLQGERLLW